MDIIITLHNASEESITTLGNAFQKRDVEKVCLCVKDHLDSDSRGDVKAVCNVVMPVGRLPAITKGELIMFGNQLKSKKLKMKDLEKVWND